MFQVMASRICFRHFSVSHCADGLNQGHRKEVLGCRKWPPRHWEWLLRKEQHSPGDASREADV